MKDRFEKRGSRGFDKTALFPFRAPAVIQSYDVTRKRTVQRNKTKARHNNSGDDKDIVSTRIREIMMQATGPVYLV